MHNPIQLFDSGYRATISCFIKDLDSPLDVSQHGRLTEIICGEVPSWQTPNLIGPVYGLHIENKCETVVVRSTRGETRVHAKDDTLSIMKLVLVACNVFS